MNEAARKLCLMAQMDRLEDALLLLHFLRDRFGPSPLPPAELHRKWAKRIPGPEFLWSEVDRVIGESEVRL